MLFYNVETFFRKNLNYIDVYELTVNDILNYNFTFPCENHKLDSTESLYLLLYHNANASSKSIMI